MMSADSISALLSVVWDTAIAAYALGESGNRRRPTRWRKCADWLLTKEFRRKGDWAISSRRRALGWYFEFANEFIPISTTRRRCCSAVEYAQASAVPRSRSLRSRAVNWCFDAIARRGWAAFDVDNNAFAERGSICGPQRDCSESKVQSTGA